MVGIKGTPTWKLSIGVFANQWENALSAVPGLHLGSRLGFGACDRNWDVALGAFSSLLIPDRWRHLPFV